MQRLLISDADGTFSKPIAKQLKNEFLVKTCDDGERAVELLRKFDPDILVIDLQLAKIDGLSVLRSMRAAGSDAKVVVICGFADDYICAELERLQVSNVYKKPCLLGAVISCIREIGILAENPQIDNRCVENDIDRILLDLGFQLGRSRYYIVHSAVMYMYANPNSFMTKSLYPSLAKQFHGSVTQVEKAIRDAIKDAWKNGNRQMWYLYFPPGIKQQDICPPNEVFLARIANSLLQRERLKRPLNYPQKLAE